MFFITESEEEKLKKEIKTLVNNWVDTGYQAIEKDGVLIKVGDFCIRLETLNNKFYSENYVKFNGRVIFGTGREDDKYFLQSLCDIVIAKEARERENRRLESIERSKLIRNTIISEALASITNESLTKASKEVKDELAPIFDKVKRVIEIQKELDNIRKEFSILN